jgi:hypothetical protein
MTRQTCEDAGSLANKLLKSKTIPLKFHTKSKYSSEQ